MSKPAAVFLDCMWLVSAWECLLSCRGT